MGDIIQYNWRTRKFSLVDVMVTNHHKAHNLDNFLEVGHNGGAKLMETWKRNKYKDLDFSSYSFLQIIHETGGVKGEPVPDSGR